MGFLSEAATKARTGLLIGLAVLACGGLFAAGCGGDDDSGSTDTTEATGTTSAGGDGGDGGDSGGSSGGDSGGGSDANTAAIALFDSSGCAGCHTLSVADASGSIGPNLDDTSLSASQIEAQIRSGGGAMPPYEGQLTDAQITSLADLILSN